MNKITLKTDFAPYKEKHIDCEFYTFNQWLFKSPNNKGFSVVCHISHDGRVVSYGNKKKPFETTFIKFHDDEHNFEILEEPIGFLTEREVNDLLHKFKEEQEREVK